MSEANSKRPSTGNEKRGQEKIRKRRHNLFRRLKEFNDRYNIEIWMTMRMPSGWMYTFNTNDESMPTESDLNNHEMPVIRKRPADYEVEEHPNISVPSPPVFDLRPPVYNSLPEGPSDHVSSDPDLEGRPVERG